MEKRKKIVGKIQEEKGITLTILIIAVTVMLIVVGMLMYNSKDTVNTNKVIYLYNDIDLIQSKISEYYLSNGEIPIIAKFEVGTIFEDNNEIEILGANDGEVFYVIDLQRLSGISLNYGNQYDDVLEYVSQLDDIEDIVQSEINKYQDLYIINEKSHNVYYVKGIELTENQRYHSSDLTPDSVEVELISK